MCGVVWLLRRPQTRETGRRPKSPGDDPRKCTRRHIATKERSVTLTVPVCLFSLCFCIACVFILNIGAQALGNDGSLPSRGRNLTSLRARTSHLSHRPLRPFVRVCLEMVVPRVRPPSSATTAALWHPQPVRRPKNGQLRSNGSGLYCIVGMPPPSFPLLLHISPPLLIKPAHVGRHKQASKAVDPAHGSPREKTSVSLGPMALCSTPGLVL